MSRIAGTLLSVVFLTGLAGCGGGDAVEKPPLFAVKGTLTLNGDALAGASVTFTPKTGPVARGVTNDKGEFTLTTFDAGDGAVEGNHTVTVYKSEGGVESPDTEAVDPDKGEVEVDTALGPGADGEDVDMKEAKLLVPKAYTNPMETTLQFVVKADGPNEAKLDMTGTVD